MVAEPLSSLFQIEIKKKHFKKTLEKKMSNDENKQQKGTERYSAEFFGKLAPYIADIDITDINCNGKDVWINHIHKGRYMLEIGRASCRERV